MVPTFDDGGLVGRTDERTIQESDGGGGLSTGAEGVSGRWIERRVYDGPCVRKAKEKERDAAAQTCIPTLL
jgi:hypothetical protein